ncbi:hypothetical protein BCS42_00095 [Crenothrix sp. D3]|nr:hypothetical protein BCS42_00095 [Crenothrix sp. D3]
MSQRTFFTVIMLAATVSVCSAGTITKGVWSPSGCGAEPVLPALNQATADNYNKSVKTINDWQQKVGAYSACVVKEANEDNASIAKSANEKQGKLQALTEKVHADTEAAKAKLDSK